MSPPSELQEIPVAIREQTGFFASTQDECLSPRVRLECNPEIPVAPGRGSNTFQSFCSLQPCDSTPFPAAELCAEQTRGVSTLPEATFTPMPTLSREDSLSSSCSAPRLF